MSGSPPTPIDSEASKPETTQLAPRTKASRGQLGAIFVTVFLDLLGFGLVIPLLPRYASSFQTTSLVIGLLGASYSLMQFVFVPVWGRLSDRIGRRPVLLGSLLATAVTMALLGFSKSLVMLFVARLLGGIATANIATAQAYVADVTTKENRAKGMGLIGMAFGLGFILGPSFGGILSKISLGTPALVAAGLAVINFFYALRALPESLPTELRTQKKARRAIGLDLTALRQAISIPGMGIILLLFLIVGISFANLEQTFSLYTNDAFGLDTAQTGYVLGVVGLVAAIVQGGLIGRLTKRFGSVRLLQSGVFFQAIAMATIAFAKGHGVAVLYLGSILLSLGNGLTNPSVSALASQRAPADAQGGTLGLLQSMGALARVIGPTWGGFVYGFGQRLPYVTAACGLTLAWLLSWSVARNTD